MLPGIARIFVLQEMEAPLYLPLIPNRLFAFKVSPDFPHGDKYHGRGRKPRRHERSGEYEGFCIYPEIAGDRTQFQNPLRDGSRRFSYLASRRKSAEWSATLSAQLGYLRNAAVIVIYCEPSHSFVLQEMEAPLYLPSSKTEAYKQAAKPG